jgi:prepilin-type N-terminal cleavage/methylation domain-containing protein
VESMLAALRSRRGFSLIELVIVVLILGIIAAIAVPRMSRGAKGAQDSSVSSDLAILRNAIDLYNTEHGNFPAVGTFEDQLTKFTNDAGAVSATKTGAYIYGPYLRALPALPVGSEKGSKTVAAAAGAGVGWIYDVSNGTISANTGALTDESGKLYTAY